jgi:NAD-dependent SIR2 family protein deacetylase
MARAAQEALGRAASALSDAESLLVLTGAGISVESGIPPFRGHGGLWTSSPALADVLTARSREQDPAAVEVHLQELRDRYRGADENEAHRILARWEAARLFGRFLLVTQNIDGLHEEAGSKLVSSVHGRLDQWVSLGRDAEEQQMYLLEGGRYRYAEYTELELLLEIANSDGRLVQHGVDSPAPDGWRSNVVLFDEGYGNRRLAVDRFSQVPIDVVLIVGCSGGVVLVDEVVRACRRVGQPTVIEINPDPTGSWGPDLLVELPASEALVRLDELLAAGGRTGLHESLAGK